MQGPVSSDSDVLYRIQRGLAGYVSYLATCDMNESFSEYLLYEPTLRILTAQRFEVECELPCRGLRINDGTGVPRIDFVAKIGGTTPRFALEMKWVRRKQTTLNVSKDIQKLQWFRQSNPGVPGYLVVFGRKSFIENLVLSHPDCSSQARPPLYAEFGRTKFGCRVYRVTDG